METHMNEPGHDRDIRISPARLEAFSDGVLAIIATITVLEFKIPAGASFSSLLPLLPLLFAYAISFQSIGTYWNNHNLLLKIADHVSPGMMWSNHLLLFCLSLIPLTTIWCGTNHGAPVPTALYAGVLLLCGLSYTLLVQNVTAHSKNREEIQNEIKRNPKGIISLIFYALAIVFAFYHTAISDVLIILVALLWIIPDKSLAKFL